MKHVFKNIKALRTKKGLSQAEVSKELGISIPALSRIESGQTDINLSRLLQIADLFKVSLLDLVAGEGNATLELLGDDLQNCREKILERDERIIKLQQALINMYEDKLNMDRPDV